MANQPRAVIIGMKSTEWIREHVRDIECMAVIGWMPVVEGAEVIEMMKREKGAENVVEWEEVE